MMLKRAVRLLPHAAILLCNMYVVLYLIDRVNPAMNFIDNGLTKGLLLLMCAVALVNARRLVARPAYQSARRASYAPGRQARPAYARTDGHRRAPEPSRPRADYREPDRYARASGRYAARPGYAQRTVSTGYARQSRYGQPDGRESYPRRGTGYDREGARR